MTPETTRRLLDAARSGVRRGLDWGSGAAFAALLLSPAARRSLRPLLVSAVRGALDVADQARAGAGIARETFEDLWVEAELERERWRREASAAEPATPPGPDGAAPR